MLYGRYRGRDARISYPVLEMSSVAICFCCSSVLWPFFLPSSHLPAIFQPSLASRPISKCPDLPAQIEMGSSYKARSPLDPLNHSCKDVFHPLQRVLVHIRPSALHFLVHLLWRDHHRLGLALLACLATTGTSKGLWILVQGARTLGKFFAFN
jgi:hypothetical protein